MNEKDRLAIAQTYLNDLESRLTGHRMEAYGHAIALILLDIAYTLRELRALFEEVRDGNGHTD